MIGHHFLSFSPPLPSFPLPLSFTLRLPAVFFSSLKVIYKDLKTAGVGLGGCKFQYVLKPENGLFGWRRGRLLPLLCDQLRLMLVSFC